MSEFYRPTYSFSEAELDELALSGDPIDSMGYSYKSNPDPDDFRSENYSIRVIGTKGLGNCGAVVLVGKTPHGRHLVRRGKVNKLVREGCPEYLAEAAASVRYGMEEPVWKLAERLVEVILYGPLPEDIRGHAHFERVTGVRDHGCSFPRVLAAVAIARKAAGH